MNRPQTSAGYGGDMIRQLIARVLHLFRHDWRDDDIQQKHIQDQHCARCPKRRAIQRESFYDPR